MAGNADSNHFEVKGNGKKPYTITINYDTGHWCTCRGMISKKKTYGEDSGRTQGTCCKHIITIIETKFDGDWGVSGGKGKPRTRAAKTVASTPTTPAQPTGRRAAIMAQRARREEEKFGRRAAHKAQKASKTDSGLSLLDRIDALAASREGATS
jgi:hypothetical protein